MFCVMFEYVWIFHFDMKLGHFDEVRSTTVVLWVGRWIIRNTFDVSERPTMFGVNFWIHSCWVLHDSLPGWVGYLDVGSVAVIFAPDSIPWDENHHFSPPFRGRCQSHFFPSIWSKSKDTNSHSFQLSFFLGGENQWGFGGGNYPGISKVGEFEMSNFRPTPNLPPALMVDPMTGWKNP